MRCGKCLGCNLHNANQWAARSVCEAKCHERTCFLTLTYSDENLPADGSIDVRHWQEFAKRLRYWQGPFRFFHCGEYGEKTNRPHYHALVYGHDFFEDRRYHKHSKTGEPLYVAECLNELWSHGHVYIGELTPESAAYVARYCTKKLRGLKALDKYGEHVDTTTGEVTPYQTPPYATMSRRPGIGQPWLDKFEQDVYPYDELIQDGKNVGVPKYFDTQLEKTDPELLASLKTKRVKQAKKQKADNTLARLAVKEKVKIAQMKSHNRAGV